MLPLLSLLVPDTFFASPAFNPFDIDFDTPSYTADDPPTHLCQRGVLPDISCTPGDVMTTDLNVICHQPTSGRRHVSVAMKRYIYEEYGVAYPQPEGMFEVDHSIPICGGGASTAANLWLQAAPDFHLKDKTEAWGCREICAGRMDLLAFQKQIAADWRVVYRQMPR